MQYNVPMETIKLYASSIKGLHLKIQDCINEHGEYGLLTIEKQSEDMWYAEYTVKERGLYIGLRRAE